MFELKSLQSVADSYSEMLSEASNPHQLTHIQHPEDRPLMHGSQGFEHAHAALMHAHEHMKAKKHSSDLTMKYDGSPSLVFGHHPVTKKFFVATKSAFNKSPKINHTEADIERNHGHAPGLVSKLKAALKHLPKVTPKSGVYQGDVMHTRSDHKLHEAVSFTPNTITYTARGDEEKKVKRSHIGVVVHQQYHPHPHKPGIEHMSVSPHPDTHNFKQHPDVHLKTAEHDTSKINYGKSDQSTFQKHMNAAKSIHNKHGAKMYKATERHQGEGGHLSNYINQTVRSGDTPHTKGFQKHIMAHYAKAASKVKTPAAVAKHHATGAEHVSHIAKHAGHYTNLLSMHSHLASAKNTLVKSLETHEGGLEHHIGNVKSKPEGFVINHKFKGTTHPTKLVNRAEFAKANFAKTRS
jgi:hypothetical protein